MRRALLHGAGGYLLASLLVSLAVAAPRMAVQIALDDLASGELRVSMQIEGNEDSTLRLRGVPTYVDNPLAEARGEVVRDLTVRSGGRRLVARPEAAGHGESVWLVSGAGDELRVDYTLRVDFVAGEKALTYPIHIPAMGPDRAWLSGNHVFLTPEFSADRVADLLTPFPVELTFSLADSLGLFGPPPTAKFNNLLQLLSLQFGVGDFEQIRIESGEVEAALIFDDPGSLDTAESELLGTALSGMIDQCVALFGGVPFPRIGLYVFRSTGIGGLEGSFACQAYLPAKLDLSDRRDEKVRSFLTVVCHELVHTWLPIGLFAADDPWFKEGVTSYYGYALAARAGWIGPAEVDRLFSAYGERVFGAVELEEVHLGAPRIWYEEYSSEAWRRLTYDRGHAVALLLDVHLRSETGNRHSLDDVMRLLFAAHAGGSFSRADLFAAIGEATGVDVREFFGRHVDQTAAPTVREVDEAQRRAIKFGVYERE